MPNMKAHKEMKLIPEQMQLPPSQRRGWLIAILVSLLPQFFALFYG